MSFASRGVIPFCDGWAGAEGVGARSLAARVDLSPMNGAFFTGSLACCSSEVRANRGFASAFLVSGTTTLAAISGTIVNTGSAITGRSASFRRPNKCDSNKPSPSASKRPRLINKDSTNAVSQRRPSPSPRQLNHPFIINPAKLPANPPARNPANYGQFREIADPEPNESLLFHSSLIAIAPDEAPVKDQNSQYRTT
jgi:hypothetical protein